MKAVSAFCLSLFLFVLGAAPAGAAPSLVFYSTELGGHDVAVDSAGNAIVLSGEYLAKVSPLGELIFRRRLEIPSRYPAIAFAVALDPAGYIYIAGTVNRSDECCVGSEAKEGFVTKLGPDGTGLVYETFFWEGEATEAHDLAVDAQGRAYVHVTTDWGQLSYGISFSPAGSLEGYFGNPISGSYLTAMALGPSGDLVAVGWKPSEDDPNSHVPFIERTDTSSGAVILTELDSGTINPADIAGAPGGGSVVVGWPSLIGVRVAGFGPEGEEVFSRILNLGTVVMSDVAVTSSGEIVLVGYTNSGSPPDAFVLRLDGRTGEVRSSITLGDSGRDYAYSVAVGPGGDAYVVGSFVARITENRPPDCSGATASPSVIWPANGKMVPVSILGVTDAEGDSIALKVTGISQDEPGAAFSGIGSSVAQVKAERDGKGDGRVYRIGFEATDPSGASCAGEVTVCVPHDRSGRSCVDSAAGRS